MCIHWGYKNNIQIKMYLQHEPKYLEPKNYIIWGKTKKLWHHLPTLTTYASGGVQKNRHQTTLYNRPSAAKLCTHATVLHDDGNRRCGGGGSHSPQQRQANEYGEVQYTQHCTASFPLEQVRPHLLIQSPIMLLDEVVFIGGKTKY